MALPQEEQKCCMMLSQRHLLLTLMPCIPELCWGFGWEPLWQLCGSIWPSQIPVTSATRIRTYMGRCHLISNQTLYTLSYRSISMVVQLNDGPASQALVLFKDSQHQASIAFGGGVMPRQHCLKWVLQGQPYPAIPKRHCPDLNWGSPVY